MAGARDTWYRNNWFYHAHLEQALRAIIPPGCSVLELGCATGNLLAALRPARGVGIDLSPQMVAVARRTHPGLDFRVADAEAFSAPERFEFVVASDLIGELLDISAMLEQVHALSHGGTRLVLTFHNPALEGVLRLAQRLRIAMPPARQNWIGPRDVENLLYLSDFSVERTDSGLLMPLPVPGLAAFANRHLSHRRGFRYLNLVTVVVATPVRPRPLPIPLSCTVVVPCRNEAANVDAAVARIPSMGTHTEIIFVDGASTDGTPERIEALRTQFEGWRDIKLIHQVPAPTAGARAESPAAMLKLGKGDAVRKGFDAASGDVVMILDADLAVPPEDLPRFFNPLSTGKASFFNGTRLVYPMEERAMKFVNYLGNKFFSVLFTWLLGQRIRDTLCGTKALKKTDYLAIKAGRAAFGDFDPFGDFDLLFGAARLRLPIVDVPVRYRRRAAGNSKVRILRHGWLLIGMSLIAFKTFKLARWVQAASALLARWTG